MPTRASRFAKLGTNKEKLRQATLELGVYLHVSFVKLARSDVMKPLPESFHGRRACAEARSSSNVPAPSTRALSVPSAISVSNIP
jgi:hypothetical protein